MFRSIFFLFISPVQAVSLCVCGFFSYLILVVDKCTYASHCDECASYLTSFPSIFFSLSFPFSISLSLSYSFSIHFFPISRICLLHRSSPPCCVSFVLHGEYELKCFDYNSHLDIRQALYGCNRLQFIASCNDLLLLLLSYVWPQCGECCIHLSIA